ncbi:MarR family winged helix-turn-helix transcriptional regulator [Millisia brevis]|uniref:MarR family winged helix-turn-helix transcriptional regulator n=1 Tax=Millisia brevis TaxID=264148 RepID=UPI0008303F3E|nr:MarR family transcriptional regulator [Millisia brevis]
MTSDEPAEVNRVAGDLSIAVLRLSRCLRAQRSNRITLTQLSTLAVLRRLGPMAPSAIAAHERVQPPSMTRVVASLVDLGLVTREQHPSDGRQVIVAISEEGGRIIDEQVGAGRDWLAARLDALTPEQVQELARAAALLDLLVVDE